MRHCAARAVCGLLIAFAFVVACVAQTQASGDQELQAALNKAFAKKVVLLKHPCPGPLLRFSVRGECASSVPPTSWTVDGAIEIEKVKVTPSAIELDGSQAIVTFDSGRDRLKQKFSRGLPVKVVIERGDADWPAIVQRMFVTSNEALSDYVPEYWKGYLKFRESGKKEWSEEIVTPFLEAVIPPQGEVLRVGGMVKAPQPISTPDPSFADYPRRAGFQGTTVLRVIVDRDGLPKDIQILRPVGFGLDERSIEAVKKWRFKPATRNGEPVAVRVAVEVNFRLH